MRICMVTTFYPPYSFGGDAIFVQELAQRLVQRGHEVSVIHCEDAFRLKGKLDPQAPDTGDDGVTVHRLKSALGPVSPLLSQQSGRPGLKKRRLTSLLNDRYDVINYHNVSLMGGPGILHMGAAPVKLYTLHEHWLVCATHTLWKFRRKACDGRQCLRCSLDARIPPQLWRYTSLTAAALKNIDRFISPSRFTADQHRRIFGDLPISVLPHFARIEPGLVPPQRGTGFVYVGRMTAAKGIQDLLRVFAQLPQYQLTVVGDGDLAGPLRAQYGAHANIRFIGFVDKARLRDIYASARALILPSLTPETFGLTVIEAMACGTPAIVRDSGGCAEIVQDTGIGAIYRDEQQLIAAIKRFDANDIDAERVACAAIEACEKYFSAPRYVDDYLQLIEQVR